MIQMLSCACVNVEAQTLLSLSFTCSKTTKLKPMEWYDACMQYKRKHNRQIRQTPISTHFQSPYSYVIVMSSLLEFRSVLNFSSLSESEGVKLVRLIRTGVYNLHFIFEKDDFNSRNTWLHSFNLLQLSIRASQGSNSLLLKTSQQQDRAPGHLGSWAGLCLPVTLLQSIVENCSVTWLQCSAQWGWMRKESGIGMARAILWKGHQIEGNQGLQWVQWLPFNVLYIDNA